MIIYFANRNAEILGHATSSLSRGYIISNDKKKEDIDSGVTSFTCNFNYKDGSRGLLEEMAIAGNYIFIDDGLDELTGNGLVNSFFTIIDSEFNPATMTSYIYAEDAGLDLLNYVCPAVREPIGAKSISGWIDYFLSGYGWEVGTNEYGNATLKTLVWDGESTATQRVLSIANSFDNCEVSFSFRIKNFTVTNKYINIYKKRGSDKGEQLRLNYNLSELNTKKSVANLTTAYQATGNIPEGSETPITLIGANYTYECKGNTWCSGGTITCDPNTGQIRCRKAMAQWRGILDSDGLLVRQYSYSTDSTQELFNMGASELKKFCWPETIYTVKVYGLLDNVHIGDPVDIVDDEGEIYFSARVLTKETSVTQETVDITIGDYKIKTSGIASKVQDLADKFSDLVKNTKLFTWLVYSKTSEPTSKSDLSLSFIDMTVTPYVGYSINRTSQLKSLDQIRTDIPIVDQFHFIPVEFGTIEGGELQELSQLYYVDVDGHVVDPETDIDPDDWSTEFDIDSFTEGSVLYTRDVITIVDSGTGDRETIIGMATRNESLNATTNKVFIATQLAEQAEIDAGIAKEAADQATEAAGIATEAAALAVEEAGIAKDAAEQATRDAADAMVAANAAGESASVAQSASEALIESYYRKYNTVSLTNAQFEEKVTLGWFTHGMQFSWDRATSEGYYQGACIVGDVLIIYINLTEQSRVTKLLARVLEASSAGQPTLAETISYDSNLSAYFWSDSTGAHVANKNGSRMDINGSSIEAFDTNGLRYFLVNRGSLQYGENIVPTEADLELVAYNAEIYADDAIQEAVQGYYSKTELGQTLSFTEQAGLKITVPGSNYATQISNEQIAFLYDGTAVAYINGEVMVIPRSVMLNEMRIGGNPAINEYKWTWQLEEDDSLSLTWLGEDYG